ncbi:helix-turn-helix transcriptional regulator [Streptomyces sp. LBL]|uniref:helix-turn-helix transcriptional regulator n=1 Tax=Streptomyces sp. LBL TaxID=2940562 RepID=UPI0024752F7A|nr:helix-turn-helix transcriptional regulator [Streptomyces sp. LBL]
MLGTVETRSVSPVFVGRGDELDTLNDALARAAEGEPQALLLGGEAGVGKTRLVEEFATAACRRDAVVVLGGCVEIGADGLPFAPFSTALRALRRELPDELAAAAAGQEEELARLLPELGEASPGRHDEEGMAHLFELTVRLLERVAAHRTVVVALEDLHWADASTRHLLAYLFRTLRTGRLVVLATYRADDIHRRHPLRPLLAELDRLRTVRRIELGRFNRAEVGRQIAGILAAEPDPAQVAAIFERSDGNAFFVEELTVAAHEGCRTGLTDSLRDLLLVRVESLPESAQRVARIVAEGGSTVEYRLLAAVARLTEDDLIEALRAAVGANILLATPGGDGYRFRHSLVREAVSDDLLPGERSRLNRRYAEALEADRTLVPADERVMRLAGYWYRAHDAAKALPAVLDASVTARRRHAHSEQLRLLERAMELWDTAPEDVHGRLRPVDHAEVYPPPLSERRAGTPSGSAPAATPLSYLDLLAEASVAGRLCGERERALKISKRALRLLDDEADPLRAAWFWVQRSRLVQAQARGDGRQELATAQELVRGLQPSEVHAEVLSTVANWAMLHEPGADAFSAAERAVEYARMVGAREIELNARLTLGCLMVDSGDVEAGLTELHEVKERGAEEGVTHVAGRAHVNLPSELEAVGRSREAVPILEEGIAYTRKHGLLDAEAWIWGNLSDSLYSLGRWDEAAEAAENALRVGHSAKPQGSGAVRLAHLALVRGDLAGAAAHLATARAYDGTHDPMPQQALPLARIVIGVAAGEGRLLDARAELDRVLKAGFPPGTQRYGWPVLLTAAMAETDARDLPAAEQGRAAALDGILGAVKKITTGAPVWLAVEKWVRAEVRRAKGQDTPEVWSEVVTAFEPLEHPYDLARVRYRLAEALLAGGGEPERARATELLRLAHTVAEHLGARPLAESAARLAHRGRLTLTGTRALNGGRAGRGGAGPGGAETGTPDDPARALGLTGRERDVLRLVSAGRTNRQIAEELFISPKTASVHVSNILAKLGVSGRGEAAAVAHRLGLFAAAASQVPRTG